MLALVGYGYVGRAIYAHLADREEITIVDPAHGGRKISEIDGLRGLIVCVPTPSTADGGCDTSIVEAVSSEAPANTAILVKSTISLCGFARLVDRHPSKRICYSPEFLRAATAARDVAETRRVILGGEGIQFWLRHYAEHFDGAEVIVTSAREAIAAKYFTNAFLATKVTYFNQLHDFCSANRIDYEIVRSLVGGDDRIGHSHTFLNESGQKGWGGACFPKDTKALLKMGDDIGVDLDLLAMAVDYNDKC